MRHWENLRSVDQLISAFVFATENATCAQTSVFKIQNAFYFLCDNFSNIYDQNWQKLHIFLYSLERKFVVVIWIQILFVDTISV